MGRKGRPSKSGKRFPSGKRVPAVPYDKGSEWVQAMRDKYQTHYNTALGRAYAAGLLHNDASIALDLYQGGKRFARIYNRIIGGETYRCPLDRTPRGGLTEIEIRENDARDKEWLFWAMDCLDSSGLRPWLDQLISRVHTDHGPKWLDRLLAGGHDPGDVMVLKAAARALEVLAPPRREMGIMVEHWNHAA